MRKLTAFGLGMVAGVFGLSLIMNVNASKGDTLYEDDEMIIKEAGNRCMDVNAAIVEYKNKEEA